MAHVANKGADCVQNNSAPQPVFKEQNCFHILKIRQGKRPFLSKTIKKFNVNNRTQMTTVEMNDGIFFT